MTVSRDSPLKATLDGSPSVQRDACSEESRVFLVARHNLDVWGLAFALGAALFVLLLLAEETGVLPVPLYLPYLSLALPLLAVPVLARWREDGEHAALRFAPLALLAAFAIALAVRLGLSLQHPVLLGYDPGLYKYVFDAYIAALPNVSESELPYWVRNVYEQGLPMLTTLLHVMAGIGPETFMRYLFPVVSAALVLPMYLVARDAFGPRAAIITALLFAVSYAHLFTFGLMYLKNVLALFLLLLALHALHHRRYAVFALLLGGVGMYQRPTFMVAVLIVAAYVVATRRREVLPWLGLAALIVAPLLLLRWEENWLLVQGGFGSGAGTVGGTASGGTFLEVGQYRWVSLGYAPFALMATVYLVMRRQWSIPLLWMVACAGLVAFQIFFFRRHLIPLDLAMLLLAGKGIELSFLYGRQWAGRVASLALVAVLLAGVAAPSWRYTREAHAMVTAEQIEAVEWLVRETPAEARVLASAYDAPWVMGWSNRDVVAPGQFDLDQHDREQWMAFLESEDPQQAAGFLAVYGQPLFIYHSGQPGSYMAVEKFQEPFFTLVHTHGPAQVWELAPNAVAMEGEE